MKQNDHRSFAFIGLGAMGRPIAIRLASALPALVIADIDSERVAAVLAASGAKASADPELLHKAQTVYLCLPSQETTRTVIAQLLKDFPLQRIFIDFGAHPPDFVNAMAQACTAESSQYCDCPVFGTPSMAERGELYFLFSGAEHVSHDFHTIADAAGYRTRYAGPTGTASKIKLLQNALGTANLAIGAEALRICEATNIEPELFINIVRECGGIGQSTVFDRFASDMAARRDSGEGRLRIAAKDMQSVVQLAASAQIASPLIELVAERFQQALQAGYGERQFTGIIELQDNKPGKDKGEGNNG
jgi:3-hydroxyisobutyrate dehydrogenase